MANKDDLKEIIQKRYEKQREKLINSLPKDLPHEVYVPYTDPDNGSDYLLKFKFQVCIEHNNLVKTKCNSVIENASRLDQKVIAKRHPLNQKDLKYYFDKNPKIGGKSE